MIYIIEVVILLILEIFENQGIINYKENEDLPCIFTTIYDGINSIKERARWFNHLP